MGFLYNTCQTFSSCSAHPGAPRGCKTLKGSHISHYWRRPYNITKVIIRKRPVRSYIWLEMSRIKPFSISEWSIPRLQIACAKLLMTGSGWCWKTTFGHHCCYINRLKNSPIWAGIQQCWNFRKRFLILQSLKIQGQALASLWAFLSLKSYVSSSNTGSSNIFTDWQ